MEIPIHILDFEGSHNSGVIEWGIVTLFQNEIKTTKTRLCSANGHINKKETYHHGLSEDLLLKHKHFSADFNYFSSLRESGPYCAHNAQVEELFLRNAWPYTRLSKNFAYIKKDKFSNNWGPFLDTLQIYRKLYPNLKSYKLDFLVKNFDLKQELDKYSTISCPPERSKYHCALYDALACTLLLKRIILLEGFKTIDLPYLFTISTNSSAAYNAMRQQDML